MFTNFMFFIIPWHYRAYGVNIFVELADNELSSCTSIIGINSRKEGHTFLTYVTIFRSASCAAQCSSGWLAGAVQKLLTFWCSYNKYMVCYKDHKKCAYQSIIKRFSLTGN